MDYWAEQSTPIMETVKGSTDGNRRRVTTYLEVEQYEELSQEAKRLGRSMSNHINIILTEYLDKKS